MKINENEPTNRRCLFVFLQSLAPVRRVAYLALWNLAPMLFGGAPAGRYPTLVHYLGSRGPGGAAID